MVVKDHDAEERHLESTIQPLPNSIDEKPHHTPGETFHEAAARGHAATDRSVILLCL
jgi:hypothetical protein